MTHYLLNGEAACGVKVEFDARGRPVTNTTTDGRWCDCEACWTALRTRRDARVKRVYSGGSR